MPPAAADASGDPFPSAPLPTLARIGGGSFSRSLFGYRPGEVDVALDSLESELGCCTEELHACGVEAERLRSEGGELRARLSQGEREITDLRTQVAAADRRGREQLHALAVIGLQLDEMRTAARAQATRIRLHALREAAELSARLADAAGVEPGSRRDQLLDALEDAIGRVSGEWEPLPPAPPLSRLREEVAPDDGTPPPRHRRISVDVGPFEDFSQLVRFEDAANAIGATGDISIKRFSEGRARIDVTLREPVDLLRELEERSDLEFEVRSTRRARDRARLRLDQTERSEGRAAPQRAEPKILSRKRKRLMKSR